MSTRTRRDLILWGALGCALVSTAHAEYTLATATGVHSWVALAVPGALDLYVIRALLSRREVPFAVLVMVAANVTSHLITAGVLAPSTPVIAAVGALAPVLLWRIYALKYASAPVLEAPDAVSASEAGRPPAWVPGYHLDGCDGVHVLEGPINCVDRASALECATPDRIPEWMHDEYPASAPRLLHSVPDLPALPPEYAPEYVTSAQPLTDSDHKYVPVAREYAALGKPTVKGLMRYAKIGQDRAQRLLDHLETEEKP